MEMPNEHSMTCSIDMQHSHAASTCSIRCVASTISIDIQRWWAAHCLPIMNKNRFLENLLLIAASITFKSWNYLKHHSSFGFACIFSISRTKVIKQKSVWRKYWWHWEKLIDLISAVGTRYRRRLGFLLLTLYNCTVYIAIYIPFLPFFSYCIET